jgi:hypothetical protein
MFVPPKGQDRGMDISMLVDRVLEQARQEQERLLISAEFRSDRGSQAIPKGLLESPRHHPADAVRRVRQ